MLTTPWNHCSADYLKVSERFNAHDTGAIVRRLCEEDGWRIMHQYSRRSHDANRRPFALHSAILRHPEAQPFQALGRAWYMSLYVRNAHNGTAALNASLLLHSGRLNSATALAMAPASFRCSHLRHTNEVAQQIASEAAQAIPSAIATMMTWEATDSPGDYCSARARALRLRFADAEEPVQCREDGRPKPEPTSKLAYYLQVATLALEGGYYLENSKRILRDVKSIATREQLMRDVWNTVVPL